MTSPNPPSTAPEATPEDPDDRILWEIHRRPPRRVVVWALVLGGLLGAGAAWLAFALGFGNGGWLIPAALGVGLGALVPLLMIHGSRVEIDIDGMLRYGTGPRMHLEVPVTALGPGLPVRSGMLVGIGFSVDPRLVRFLDRRGLSYASMRGYQRHLGQALVLEFLTPADASAIAAWRRSLEADAGRTTEGEETEEDPASN